MHPKAFPFSPIGDTANANNVYVFEKHIHFQKMYTFFAIAVPPFSDNENAFGGILTKPPSTSVSNLGLIGRCVQDLWHFL